MDIMTLIQEGKEAIDAIKAMLADGKVTVAEVVDVFKQVTEAQLALADVLESVFAGESGSAE